MLNKEVLTQKLDKFVALLGIDADVEYEFVEEPNYIVKVMFKGENLGYAIGNHGQNIKSIQYVLSLMLKNILKKDDEDEKLNGLRVLVDIGDYRASRVEKLIEMAKRKADDARILGEPVDLPPMSPADRREIHLYLQDFTDIKTESMGEDEDRSRFIRIIPVTEESLGIVEPAKETEESEEDSE